MFFIQGTNKQFQIKLNKRVKHTSDFTQQSFFNTNPLVSVACAILNTPLHNFKLDKFSNLNQVSHITTTHFRNLLSAMKQ